MSHSVSPSAHTVPTTTTAINPQIEVDRTARIVSSLITNLTWVAPGGSPSLTPLLQSLINVFFSVIPMDLLAEAITTNVTLMEILPGPWFILGDVTCRKELYLVMSSSVSTTPSSMSVLTDQNWPAWSAQARAYMMMQGWWSIVKDSTSRVRPASPSPMTAEVEAAQLAWDRDDEKAMGFLIYYTRTLVYPRGCYMPKSSSTPPPTPAQASSSKGKKCVAAPVPSRGISSIPPAPSTNPKPLAAKLKKPTFAEAAKSTAATTTGVNPPKFNLSPKIALPIPGLWLAVIKHINHVLAPSYFQLKGCVWSPFSNFIATPHSPEDVDRLPRVLPRILQDMFKVPFLHLTFNLSSLVVVYNLPPSPSGQWTDPSAMASVLMTQNNITEPLPASPGRWLANPDCHKGATVLR
ncbi:hypothetical protein BOTBODRAFT_172987 [Botryobasidium botryosum FD-172 SS1]|uniref:Uncharacterized protein n=1 Tax=Botryobasidium botryosum (strain FD-172 SS1) TaxID=930990 RepID=A0A067MX49_BOTB1|nr:hypothetical protein BOTBODRAFT_172987 [Botryobasidium botryosum FD-172 SS1]